MGSECAVVWDRSLLDYDLGGEHPLHPIRLELTIELASALGVLDGVEFVKPRMATDAELGRVHTSEYLAAVRSAPLTGWEAGHGLGTDDNPIFEQMHDAAALIAGGSITAAEQIVSGRADRAVHLAGGLHHAMSDHAAGFCIYNDCAVAIAWMLDQGVERIAYVDVDVHHGDGVQAAFYDDPRVLTVSLHQHPLTLWPHTGFPAETGSGGAEGTAVNIPLPPTADDSSWLRAFHAVVPSVLAEFRPQVLVTQCGADAHKDDPLADLMLSVDGQRACYQALRECAQNYAAGKWLALGGGGYSLFRVVPRAWTHLLATTLDRDLDPQTTIPEDWIARAVHAGHNVPLPTAMTDGVQPSFTPWDGVTETPVDTGVRDVRHAVFPSYGLDPADARD
ncbi:MAG: acetoin utilization protein AcuC [Saccharopolyspora rectivirgula]|jgi:acetoin utilization protein AcuC|uniref:Acetoin utilization protein AcuC n=1 Tax=Saccharopolyspora rectivirgula TaxID=28042 RepID=A0A073AX01_9PSEU|nr:acetoin utilization protein AcuC [Saccharopolyspora rectivirgula]KEI44298.1 acetoin utilization protein AcuC [Saccharopolyspora rectivirgula]